MRKAAGEPNLVDLYKRWLFEVRGAGNYALADELLAGIWSITTPCPVRRPVVPATCGPRRFRKQHA
jgi:hypothetical protein